MNALVQQARGFWLMLADDSGPVDTTYYPDASRWRGIEQAQLEQLVRAAYPRLEVLSVAWAPNPRDFTVSDEVLVVRIPGTHAVATLKPKPAPKPRRAQVVVREPDEEPGEYGESKRYWTYNRAPVPAPVAKPVDATVVHTCACGIGHTLGSFRALPLLAATDRTEGFTAIHDETRACACGPLLVTTKRLLGEKR